MAVTASRGIKAFCILCMGRFKGGSDAAHYVAAHAAYRCSACAPCKALSQESTLWQRLKAQQYLLVHGSGWITVVKCIAFTQHRCFLKYSLGSCNIVWDSHWKCPFLGLKPTRITNLWRKYPEMYIWNNFPNDFRHPEFENHCYSHTEVSIMRGCGSTKKCTFHANYRT